MHVDGFRFDEASILARGEDGVPMRHPPLVWNVELSDTLAQTKLIAEAWDAAGLYQVGQFPGYRWAEWNGRYRDDIRRFVRGDRGLVGAVAARIAGSSDLYQAEGRRPVNSINFITCHDGFTLRDLVSYNHKHNEANGWGNRDGVDDNLSWNCGHEGETDDPAVNVLRQRQIKNFLAILLLSQGVPMLMAGDELGRTQQGNNNAYCQDNELTWIDWHLRDANAGLLDFARGMIALRKAHASLRRAQFFTGAVNARGLKDIEWHGCRLGQPGWQDPASGVLAFTLGGSDDEPDLHVMMNMEDQDLAFDVPSASGLAWWGAVDTAQASPNDLLKDGAEVHVAGDAITVAARSVVVLRTRPYQRN
jgi:glycogen operon protein